ncbi:sugar transferase [bacterium]|nr:sugar transferase [bacterium]
MYSKYIKRIFDFLLALSLLIIVSPIIIIICIILSFVNKGNPFFIQRRPGKNNKVFRVIKFKTMTNEKDKNGELLPDNKRLTIAGRFVRKTSLDELPQLINVIKGDMSFIGPRPLLEEYLPLYNDFQKRRHEVSPGITGWAQINGRNTTLFSKRFEFDVWYVDNLSLFLDIKIAVKTICKVFSSEGNIPGQNVFDVDDVGFNKAIENDKKK